MNNSNDPFWRNLFRKNSDQTHEITEMWMQTPLFENIPYSRCHELVSNMHPREYKANETIFNAGDIGASVVLIRHGEVDIKTGDQTLAQLIDGDFFGEIALIIDEPRTAKAVATVKSELIFFLRSDLDEWIQRSPKDGAQFMLNISRILAARLKQTNQLLSSQES